MLTGLAVFLVLGAAGLAGEILLIDRLRHSPVNDWLADHIYLPALRMPALIGFVLGAYPALYGLESGPALAALLDFDWFGRAMNVLFVLPLLFSLLPVAGHITALVLPLQGLALVALLFTPLAARYGLSDLRYLPDPATLAAVLAFSIAGHHAGTRLAASLPQRKRTLPLYDACVLLCQAPAILVYGKALGTALLPSPGT